MSLSRPFGEALSPWDFFSRFEEIAAPACCNICWWTGTGFEGFPHSESSVCPSCGSVARDRFLFFCLTRCTQKPREHERYRLLETSPRLGEHYREAMSRWFDYRASDFDERAHRGQIRLDLQDIELEDESVDILLTPHVLEHVENVDRALAEVYRILSKGGRVFLQVPVLQGWTTPPPTPEFHGDDTPVFWRFGFDLTDRLRAHGFSARLLCNDGFFEMVKLRARRWPDPAGREFDVRSILAAARINDLAAIADSESTRRLGFYPSYMFLTWEATRLY